MRLQRALLAPSRQRYVHASEQGCDTAQQNILLVFVYVCGCVCGLSEFALESYLQICYAWTGKEALGVLSFVRL